MPRQYQAMLKEHKDHKDNPNPDCTLCKTEQAQKRRDVEIESARREDQMRHWLRHDLPMIYGRMARYESLAATFEAQYGWVPSVYEENFSNEEYGAILHQKLGLPPFSEIRTDGYRGDLPEEAVEQKLAKVMLNERYNRKSRK